jgi:hypothetical protein
MFLLPTGSRAYSRDIMSGTGKLVGVGGAEEGAGEGQAGGTPEGTAQPPNPTPEAPGAAEVSPPSAEDEAAIRDVLTKLAGDPMSLLAELAVRDQRPVLAQILGPLGGLQTALKKLGEGRESTAPKTTAWVKTAQESLVLGLPTGSAEIVAQASIRMAGPDKAVVEIGRRSIAMEREAQAWFVRLPPPLPSEAAAVDFANAIRDFSDEIGQVSAGLDGGTLTDDAAGERANAAFQRFWRAASSTGPRS